MNNATIDYDCASADFSELPYEVSFCQIRGLVTLPVLAALRDDCSARAQRTGATSMVVDMRSAVLAFDAQDLDRHRAGEPVPDIPVAIVTEASITLAFDMVQVAARRSLVRGAFTGIGDALRWAQLLGSALASVHQAADRPSHLSVAWSAPAHEGGKHV